MKKSVDQLRYETCHAWFLKPAPPKDARVLRWESNPLSLATIRAFVDGSGANRTQSYAGLTDDELELNAVLHGTTGAEKLINAANGAYAFNTRTGCGMCCCIQWDESDKPPIYGTLYFGIDASWGNLVYHRYLVENKGSSHPLRKIFKGPKLQEELKLAAGVPDSEEKEFSVVGAYAPTVSAKGVVQLRYAHKRYSLLVYPIRPQKLPEGLFDM